MDISWFDIALSFVTVLVGVIALIKWNFNYWERRNVPYIKPSLPMGNFEAPWATKKGFHATLFDMHNKFKASGHKYGGMFLSLRPVFIPVDLDLMKCIMIKDFQHFLGRGVYYNEKDEPLSAHLFTIEGDKWRSLRTRLSPMFTSGKMKYMFQTVMDCAGALEKEVEKSYVNKQPFNIKEVSALFTTNVIGSCAFGLDCDAFANPNNEFRYHTKKLFKGDLKQMLKIFFAQIFPKFSKYIGLKMFTNEMTSFYYDVIKDIVEHRESGVNRNDFIQLLVEIKNGARKSEESFTFNEIAAQAFIFFLAGFETSSSTMTFAFYEMAKNPEIQDKVREEIRNVSRKYDGKITYEGVMEMNYLGQVFDETLRKYPIVGTIDRQVTKDYKVPGSDLVLEKGTKVLISQLAIHNDPEFYPDPQKFDPDRFLPENRTGRHTCEYMPFGEGPRICIGMRFGVLQAKIGMAVMLKNYKYTLNPKLTEITLDKLSIFLSPAEEVLLDIERIN